MSDNSTPTTLLLDLDDTIVSFSVGTSNLWCEILTLHAEALGGVDPGELARVVQQEITPIYWGDAERAAWGRRNMYVARQQVLKRALDFMGREANHAAIAAAADAFTDAKEEAVAPLDDAVEVLGALKRTGLTLGLITNGSSTFQRRKLMRYDLERYFDVILVEEEWGVGKPDITIFEEALRALSAEPTHTWMVGDNFEADIVGAHQVGVRGVWMQHGRQPPPHPEVRPLASIDHIRELSWLLKRPA